MIKDFAEFLSLTIWDWMAFVIALFSFCVAFMSLMIAKKTLASQQQTEKNTMPIINLKTQEVLFGKLMSDTYRTRISLEALWLLVREEKKAYLSKHIINSLKLDSELLHCELFYNNPTFYLQVNDLQKKIKYFNMHLAVVNEYFSDYHGHLDYEIKEKYMSMLEIIIRSIVLQWITAITTIFEGNYTDILKKWMIEEIENEEENEKFVKIVVDNSEMDYYKDREDFVLNKNRFEKELIESYSNSQFALIFSVDDDHRDKIIKSMVDNTITEYLSYKVFLLDK